jgi:V-type H+-transporting ATPase subunit C
VTQENAQGWGDICRSATFEPVEVPKLYVVVPEGNEERLYQLDQYVRTWKWDDRLISARRSISELANHFSNEVQLQEDELRTASTSFSEAGNKVMAIRRRNEGSLLVRSLDEIGSKLKHIRTHQDFVVNRASKSPMYVDTRNLTTVLVVMKKAAADDFVKGYDVGANYVVPESLQTLEQDNEFSCFSVTLIRDHIDDYKTATREKGWHVRDFVYNPRMREELDAEAQQVVTEYLTEASKFSDHLVATFSHIAVVWMHVKALRVFVEATLLYGIPPNFKSFLVACSPKNIPKIHKELEKTFTDGIQDALDDSKDQGADESDYHPYVSFQLNLVGLVQPAEKRK